MSIYVILNHSSLLIVNMLISFCVIKVVSENWVVYHYFNLRAHRFEIAVIEIYDQSRAVWLVHTVII